MSIKNIQNFQENVLKTLSEKSNDTIEKMVIKRLSDMGFNFKTKKELYSFAKKRMKIVLVNELTSYMLDSQIILSYKPKAEMDLNFPYKAKVTIEFI